MYFLNYKFIEILCLKNVGIYKYRIGGEGEELGLDCIWFWRRYLGYYLGIYCLNGYGGSRFVRIGDLYLR